MDKTNIYQAYKLIEILYERGLINQATFDEIKRTVQKESVSSTLVA